MKKSVKALSSMFAILTLVFGLLLVPSIQDYAYSKTMSILTEECTVTETTYGKNRVVGCWGSKPDVCKEREVTGPCEVVLEKN